jgi:hypothetical protein
MSFLDTLKNLGLWQQPQAQQQPNPYGLSPEMVKQARMQALGNIGGQIMAMSAQMTPDQRARMMGQADWTGGMQSNLYNAAQMQLMGDAQRRKAAESERDRQAQAFVMQQINSMPNGPLKQKALIYAQLGDYAKAAEQLTPEVQKPNYQLVDGQVIDMNNPLAGAQQVPGLVPKAKEVDPKDRLAFVKEFEGAPEVQSYNVLASTVTSLSNAVYDDSKVSDLDFVYGVAKALDPTSVVRESEAGMVIDAQGLDAATLGRINGIWGGGALLPNQRLELLSLVRRRAEALRPLAETKRKNILEIGAGVVDERFIRPIPQLAPNPVPPAPRIDRAGKGALEVPFPEPELIEVSP